MYEGHNWKQTLVVQYKKENRREKLNYLYEIAGAVIYYETYYRGLTETMSQ
jgi:hypothetical protein